jgi:hypothetical protein
MERLINKTARAITITQTWYFSTSLWLEQLILLEKEAPPFHILENYWYETHEINQREELDAPSDTICFLNTNAFVYNA